MAKVEIYTQPWCGYCFRAKRLLDSKGVEYVEFPLDMEPQREAEMIQRSRGWTVPQILIDGKAIGGSDELAFAFETGGEGEAGNVGEEAEGEREEEGTDSNSIAQCMGVRYSGEISPMPGIDWERNPRT